MCPPQPGEPNPCLPPNTLILRAPDDGTGQAVKAITTKVGMAQSISFGATGGSPPYGFTATGLPAGVAFNSSTGLISGTPTVVGTSSVNVTVTDNAHVSASFGFSWTVAPKQVQTFTGFGSGTTRTSALTEAKADAQQQAAAQGFGSCTTIGTPTTTQQGGIYDTDVTMSCSK